MATVTHTEAPYIAKVRHAYPHTGWPVTTKFGRWLNSIQQRPGHWLVKQNNGYVTNVFDAVVDDFGSLVPTQQVGGFMANSAPEFRAQAMRREWVQ